MGNEKKRILIVEDSELVARMLTQYLSENGFEILWAENGAVGIEKAYKEIPDLIIMDVDMPLLQGYQASRLLKSKRGVKDIPIIMHTSRSEEKDMFWASTCGVNDFVTKDFDNLESLLTKVKELISCKELNRKLIEDDAANINKDFIFEMVSQLLDNHLFQSTILNHLGEAGKSITSLAETASKSLEILQKVCDYHIAALILKFHKQPISFIMPHEDVFEKDVDDFLNICMNDFHDHFPSINLSTIEKAVLGISHREDFNKLRLDNKTISSYTYIPLKGNGGHTIGTLHIGNFTNNYFSPAINENVDVFAEGAGIIFENALLMKQVTEMEKKIRTVFAKFVPAEIIDSLVERQSSSSLLIGEKRKVAILFSDIRNFTTISENNRPEDVVTFLNNFFEIMGSIIDKFGGTIDKFVGDAILAIFGAPRSYEDNANRAVTAAIEMMKSLSQVKIEKLLLPSTGFSFGIGIHEGEVIVGNIGSKDKFDYTVIGDNVNLASRLEGLTKHYNKRIIVSEAIKNDVDSSIYMREIDVVKVKGKDIATPIYAVEIDGQTKFPEDVNKDFLKGLSMYKIKNWSTAIEYFNKVMQQIPDDSVSNLYIKRCKNFQENPPPVDWDGSTVLDFK